MPRTQNAAADALIDKPFPCLDKGHVMLIDYMGDDASIVQAARVSYGKDVEFDAVKDRKLIHYLMSHRHTTPFEMVQIKVRMKLPIFVARQWVRHRTASLNEVSGRYTQLKDDFYVPRVEDIRTQSATNKQGSGEAIDNDLATQIREDLRDEQKGVYENYDLMVKSGMAKELARINLPVSTYTEWYWNQSLHNMFHLLGLRMDSHAQYEIRVYANALWEIVKAIAPMACEAFEEHRLNGASFSGTELGILASKMMECHATPWNIDVLSEKLGSQRAAMEFDAKFGHRLRGI